jgi:hypothetical protein
MIIKITKNIAVEINLRRIELIPDYLRNDLKVFKP